MDNLIGYQRTALADFGFPVSANGTAVTIYGYNVIPLVTGVSPDIIFQTSDGGTVVIQSNTTPDVAQTVIFAEGITFPTGCWIDTNDALNISAVTIFYQKAV